MPVALISHPACLAHDMGLGHPECPDRLRVVLNALDHPDFAPLHRENAPMATREQLLRAHPEMHIETILSIRPAGSARVQLDADTIMSAGSADAALLAAGGACAAVDAVMQGQASAAFVAVRPPGHHAEPMQAMGFCLFGNAVIAALHARARFGIRRIAVIDFDVHHGNGSQAMMQGDPELFYASSHQSPCYPGTGQASECGVAGNVVNLPLPPGSGSAAFRQAWSRVALPALDRFSPELLIISAGFDAHRADPLAQLDLEVEDFVWITRELMAIADRRCESRVVSLLEGGYDLAGTRGVRCGPCPYPDAAPGMTVLFFQAALLPDGWQRDVRIEVQDDRIVHIVPDAVPQSDDQHAGLALPGMPNLHSHAFQRGMSGLSERRSRPDDSFWSWREVMYRFLDRMTPEDVEAVTAQAYVEMLEGGFTRVGEFHYLHNDVDGRPYADPAELAARIVSAASQTGIRLTLLPCFYAHGDFGAAPAQHGQRRFLNTIDGFAALFSRSETLLAALPGATLGLAPHSLRAVPPFELAQLVELAGDRPIHIHAAEQTREVETCLAWSGQRPVEWLLDHAPLDTRWCLIHATHMTVSEIAGLARSGAAVGLCPLTESSLGDGIFAAEAWRDAGGGIGIGTDSNVQVGVAAELRQLEYGQRLITRRRNVLATEQGVSTGASLFRAALAGGSRVLAAPAPLLEEGSPADIIGLSPQAACFAAADLSTLLDCWIFGGDRDAIADVWCGGRHVVRQGRHVHADAVRSRYREHVQRLAMMS